MRILLLTLLLASCLPAGDDTIGADAGAIGQPDAALACVAAPDSCTGVDICIAGTCQAALPRTYQLTNMFVTVPETNPNTGGDWDIGGGAPDLFLTNAAGTVLTPVADDTFATNFRGPFDVALGVGGTLELQVWDLDAAANDYVIGCVANPITAAELRTGEFGCTSMGMSLQGSIGPK